MDMKAIREKLAQLNKKGGSGSEHILKLEEGETKLRIVPLKGHELPFQELKFHYGLGGKTYLSPLTYGERDPIAEFSDALIAEGGLSKEEYKQAKKFSPQTRTYVPVIVRGRESEGVKFWAFGVTIYRKLLGIFGDEDYGDISDPETGSDLKVTFTPQEKSSTDFAETDITVARKPSVLTEDPAVLKKLLNEQPVLLDQFVKHSFDDLTNVLERVVNPNAAPSAPKSSGPKPTAASVDDDWGEEEPKKAAPAKKAGKAKVDPDVEKDFDALFNDEE